MAQLDSHAPSLIDVLPPEMLRAVADAAHVDDHLALKLSCKTFNACLPEPLPVAMCKYYAPGAKTTLKQSAHDPIVGCRLFRRYDPPLTWSGVALIKTFQAHMKLEDAISLLPPFESPLSRIRPSDPSLLSSLLCTGCGHVQARELFEDAEADKDWYRLRFRSREEQNKCDDPRYWMQYRGSEPINERVCMPCKTHDGHANIAQIDEFSIKGKHRFVCGTCKRTLPLKKRVFFYERRDKGALGSVGNEYDQNYCTICADKAGLHYEKLATGPGYVLLINVIRRYGYQFAKDSGKLIMRQVWHADDCNEELDAIEAKGAKMVRKRRVPLRGLPADSDSSDEDENDEGDHTWVVPTSDESLHAGRSVTPDDDAGTGEKAEADDGAESN